MMRAIIMKLVFMCGRLYVVVILASAANVVTITYSNIVITADSCTVLLCSLTV